MARGKEESGARNHWEVLLPGEEGPDEVLISGRNEYAALSNFAYAPFVLDGIRFSSVEGFIAFTRLPDPERPDPLFEQLAWQYERDAVRELFGHDARRVIQYCYRKYGKLAKRDAGFDAAPYYHYCGQRVPFGSHDDRSLRRRALRAKFEQNEDLLVLLLSTAPKKIVADHVSHGTNVRFDLIELRDELLRARTRGGHP